MNRTSLLTNALMWKPDKWIIAPAVLMVNITINEITPPDPGPNRPKIIDFLTKMIVRTLPRNPRGEGGQEKIDKHPQIQLGNS